MDRPVLFYDGLCSFCNGSVKFVLRHDKKGIFRFAALDSAFAKDKLKGLYVPDSGVLIYNGKRYVESDVLFKVFLIFGGWWKIPAILRFIPHFLRDSVYRIIARNRYKWFGKYEHCPLPKPEWKERFLI